MGFVRSKNNKEREERENTNVLRGSAQNAYVHNYTRRVVCIQGVS